MWKKAIGFVIFMLVTQACFADPPQRWVLDACSIIITHPERSFNCYAVAQSPEGWCGAIGGANYALTSIEIQPNANYVTCRFTGKTGGGVTQYGKRDVLSPPIECPEGMVAGPTGDCVWPKRKKRCEVGNPIEVNSGSKVERETDITLNFMGAEIQFTREYRSDIANIPDENSITKPSWFFAFNDRITYAKVYYPQPSDPIRHRLEWYRKDGRKVIFNGVDVNALSSSDNDISILPRTAGTANSGWIIKDEALNEYTFDTTGELVRYSEYNKYTIDFTRSPLGDTVSAYLGTKLLFTLNKDINRNSIINKFILPDGKEYQYIYDNLLNLTKVIYPNATFKQYFYEDTTYLRGLTGIKNENNIRYVTWSYDANGKAKSSEHAQSQDLTSLNYDYFHDLTDPRLTETNALGKQTIYHFSLINNQRFITRIDGVESAHCASAFRTINYDTDGEIKNQTDWKGNLTTFEVDNKKREIKKVEASGTDIAKTTETCWHETLTNVPIRKIEAKTVTIYDYWPGGQLKSQITKIRPAGTVTCTSAF